MNEIRIGRLRRDRGVSVARPTVLGNPFAIGADGERDDVIEKYRRWFRTSLGESPAVEAKVAELTELARKGDLTLLCWCAPKRCHAEVVAAEIRRRVTFS